MFLKDMEEDIGKKLLKIKKTLEKDYKTSSHLADDYRTKHQELNTVYKAFLKQRLFIVKWLREIEEIQKSYSLMTEEERKVLKLEQNKIMSHFEKIKNDFIATNTEIDINDFDKETSEIYNMIEETIEPSTSPTVTKEPEEAMSNIEFYDASKNNVLIVDSHQQQKIEKEQSVNSVIEKLEKIEDIRELDENTSIEVDLYDASKNDKLVNNQTDSTTSQSEIEEKIEIEDSQQIKTSITDVNSLEEENILLYDVSPKSASKIDNILIVDMIENENKDRRVSGGFKKESAAIKKRKVNKTSYYSRIK